MAAAIDPGTSVGPVALTVRDLAVARDFYERVVGLSEIETGEGRITIGVRDRALVELVEDRSAPPRPPRTTGLFHLALLVPDRAELAHSLQRLIDMRWPLAGASDHLVSEALYLGDPEGNGIEIYRDRPRDEWRRDGDELRMATLPLDLEDLMTELDGSGESTSGLPRATTMGHVHLNVADLAASERFYSGLLGLDVTARGYPGALFVAAGGYHHHIGLNIWRGEGAPAPPVGALGLRSFGLELPSRAARDEAVERLASGGVELITKGDATTVRDPSGNLLSLRAAG